uniref:Uncharacterized protein n=1 Tax=Arundo donax TaxID=35708 RepID=A0A0A9AHY5_ARUDO
MYFAWEMMIVFSLGNDGCRLCSSFRAFYS